VCVKFESIDLFIYKEQKFKCFQVKL